MMMQKGCHLRGLGTVPLLVGNILVIATDNQNIDANLRGLDTVARHHRDDALGIVDGG